MIRKIVVIYCQNLYVGFVFLQSQEITFFSCFLAVFSDFYSARYRKPIKIMILFQNTAHNHLTSWKQSLTFWAKIWLSKYFPISKLCLTISNNYFWMVWKIGHCVTQVEIEKGSLKGVSPISLIKSLTECCIKFSTYSGLKPLYIF